MKAKTETARVSLAFLRWAIALILAFVRNAVTQMTANPNFTTPVPPLADVTAAADALEAANNAAEDGGQKAILDRDAKKAALLSLMRQLAAYVNLTSNGDKAVLISSGFHATKTWTPVGPLLPPVNLRLSPGVKRGEFILRMKRVFGVTAGYTIQTAEAPDGRLRRLRHLE